jgi:type IV pilus assembly protein PilW
MTASPTSSSRRAARRHDGGFTLVELMVALLLSLLLAVAMLKMQSKMASQTMRVSDTGTRDTQARAAMDVLTRDLSSAGFMIGNSQYPCDALFTFNSASGFFVHHPADAFTSVTGTQMNFAPTLTMNYPPAGSAGLTSDVLVTVSAKSTAQFNDTNVVLQGQGGGAGTPLTTGTLSLSTAPTNLIPGETAIVQAPTGTKMACLRVPISAIAGTLMTSSPGTTMPAGFYNGFVAPVAGAGFTSALTTVGIQNAWVVDIGTAATSTQVQTVYYVDGSGAYPVLMRAQYSLADDTVVTAPQPIAAGVVALRVSFGVDPANTGAVTAYQSGAQVTASNNWSFVRSVRVALVTRTINDDPNADSTAYAAPTTIPIGPSASASSPAWFPSITVPASTHRYVVTTTEIAYRNWLWNI